MSTALSGAKPTPFWEVDVGNVEFGDCHRRATGSLHAPIVYNGERLRLQTPMFDRVFVNMWQPKPNEVSGQVKYDIKFQMYGADEPGSDVNKFLNKWVKPFDELVRNTALSNVDKWFKKAVKPDDIRAFFTSPLKPSTDPDRFPEGFKANLPTQNGKPKVAIYGPDKQPISWEDAEALIPTSKVVAIVEYGGVWFMPKSFGVTPVVLALQIFPNQKLVGFSFVTKPGEEEDAPASKKGRGDATTTVDTEAAAEAAPFL